MKQKLFTLLTLLLVGISGAWADTTYKLIDRTSTPTLDNTNFRVGGSSALATTYGEKTFDVALSTHLTLGGTQSSTSGLYDPKKYIAYDIKTTATRFRVYVYNGNSSNQHLFYTEIKEGETSEPDGRRVDKTVTGKSIGSTNAETPYYEYNTTNTKNSTVYFYVGNTNVVFYQIEVVESGTALLTGGARGYEINLNKGRLAAPSGAAASIDGIEFKLASNYGVINKTAAEITTKESGSDNGHYIKFTTTQKTKTTVTVSSSNTYYVASTKDASSGVQATKTTTADVELAAGTWYIVPNGSKVSVTNLAFAKPDVPKLTGAWKIAEETVTEANVVQGSAAPTVPTFTVGAESGTPVASDYEVEYSLKAGSTEGIFTYTAEGGPTAISTTNAGTATIIATLTTTDDEKFETPATNTFEYAVTVAAASAPTIDITGSSSAARGADAITLTADVTGTPTPSIEWFQCDDALKTNPVSQGAASTANTTFDVATTTVGTYYFYAVANNGVGGDGDHNVFSDVKTITIVPKAPTMPAAVKFTTSKTVTIAKADGEAVAATIRYKEGDGDWQDYSEALTLIATKTITAKVIQGGLESAEVSRTYTKVDLTEPTSISGATTWDWTTITNGSNIDFGDEGEGSLRNVDVLFCDISKFDYSAITAPAAFNQTALIMNGQRPYANANSTKHCQVNSLKFTTTVAGKVSIEYANTGGNPARTVCVQVGAGDPQYGTHSSTGNTYSTNYVTDEFNISAGTITIKGVLDSDHSEDKMLRIRKIVFTLPEPTDPVVAGSTVTLATTANMDGWRSYNNSSDKKYTVSANTKVYYASATGDNKVTLEEIAGGVPANTAVILHKTDAAGAAAEIVLTETDASITAPGSNELLVSTAGQNLGKVYRLGYKSSDGVGFYTYTTTSAPAGIIYVSSVSSANFLGLDFGEGDVTAINKVEAAKQNAGEYYNLAGQRVAQPTKGLYIVNGKKVIVK